MTTAQNCERCGRKLPGDSPGGLCPRCLLSAGLDQGGAGRPTAPTPAEIQDSFPQLEILELLGQGGMGLVYKARQRNLDRLVALKILIPDVAGEAGFADRFAREARMLARLVHPHIVALHEFGETDGLYYLILEYVDGPNLRQVMNSGGLDPRQALAIVPQICEALQFAHDQGVVHRDVKPENVLLDRQGRVKIADFGLAKLVGAPTDSAPLTRAGQVMGTVHYMAPEQYRQPNEVDHRADIYSLGVVFYEMLTGQLPIGRFAPPSQKVQVDVRLDDVVLRALETERDQRFQHASDVKNQVDTISRTEHRRAKPRPPVPDRPRTSRLAVGCFVAFGLGFLGLLVMPFVGVDSEGNSPPVRIGALLVLLVLFVGLVTSFVATVRISLSRGRLRGLGWSVSALILNFLMFGASFLVFTFAARPVSWSGVPEPASPPSPDYVALQGPPEWMEYEDRVALVQDVSDLLSALAVVETAGAPDPDAMLAMYPRYWRGAIENLPEKDLLELRAMEILGIPLAVLDPDDPTPFHHRSAQVYLSKLSEPGWEVGRVVLLEGRTILEFPVERDRRDGQLRCSVGGLRRSREGFMFFQSSSALKDPAVEGLDHLDETDRLDLRAQAEVLWRSVRASVAEAQASDPIPRVELDEDHWLVQLDDGKPLPPFDLSIFTMPITEYDVALIVAGETHDTAHLIVEAGQHSVRVPMKRVDGSWWLAADLVSPAYRSYPVGDQAEEQ